jgi:beta-glucosidase
LKQAVSQGLIKESEIDVAVRRLFEARFRLGLFDPASMVPYTNIPISAAGSAKHAAIARKAALESIVLLQNKEGALPLKRNLRTIAVIGPNADNKDVLLGNYYGAPTRVTSLLEGIKGASPRSRILYAKGCEVNSLSSLDAVPAAMFRTPDGKPGLRAEYFANRNLQGQPTLTRTDKAIDFDWGQGSPAPGIGVDEFSVRWTGELVPDRSGDFSIGITNDDGMRVWIDGKLLLDDWRDDAVRTSTKTIKLERGKTYDLKVEYYDNRIYAVAKLVWVSPNQNPYSDAVAAAKKADTVVMVLGISGAIENESLDRESITLPQVQANLLKTVQRATSKPIILVLVNGGPITLNPSELKCPGILEAWYPGQEGGRAVADVLFGDVSPSGRLPVTVVKSLKDLPPLDSYVMKNRTYRYPGPAPLYPFGFGLSYTTFQYRDLRILRNGASNQTLGVMVKVKNTGKRASDEVVQVYRHFVSPSRPMPERQLVAFRRIHLKVGEERDVALFIEQDQLKVLGDDSRLHSEAGRVTLSIGGGQPGFTTTLSATVDLK